ncbi:calpain-9 [Neolamprologus brichardi]|uniref:calpain-9 n=1 Tax=Neolamprologus brichardi TaxID=32507 RepID=UPI001643E596|nr:calpain-9 [Neolamprologus brichardi]
MFAMKKSVSVSSESSLPPPEDDVDGDVCSDELLGSQSRRWLTDILSGGIPQSGEVSPASGLFVDSELCSSPQFIVDGATRLDFCQGKLSDCWLLSAIASLSMNQSLLKKVVPLGQSFQDGYSGCFTFRFWQYGQWEEVQIDDLLPTVNNNLIFLRSPDRQEFWSALLEKAYAKLNGGYLALGMGYPHEAMVDMTGGVTEVFQVASLPRDLPTFLRHLLVRGALINCANCQGPLEQRNELGIMFRHAYALTAVDKVTVTEHDQEMLNQEWKTVSIEEQKRLGRVRQEDGEFWMSVSDFRQNFDMMEVCHLTEILSEPGSSMLPLSCIMHHGTWEPNITAGGRPQGGWFYQNPQFYFVLSKADENLDSAQKTCSFVLALMQKHQRRRAGVNECVLSLQAHPKNTYLSREDLSVLRPVLCSPEHVARREVVLRDSLPPGTYIIIPSTAEPNQQGAFLLRVLTEQGNNATPARKPTTEDITPVTELFIHTETTETLTFLYCACMKLLAGSEKYLTLEQCKSLVVLMDDIFLTYDKDKTQRLEYQEVMPSLKAAGIWVDKLVMQLVGLRYTELDMTISYPGFLYLLMKLESMIHKFQAYDVMGTGAVTISYRQWLHMTMYN